MVHRRTNALPNRWGRTTEGEAPFDAETGFTVWELSARAAARVNLVPSGKGFQPFQWPYDEIVAEERARVDLHEPLPGEENIFEDIEEEFVGQDPSPFDRPESVGGSGSPPSSGFPGGRRGHQATGSTSSVGGAPSTPSRRGEGMTSSPLHPASGSGGPGSGGRGSGSSQRGRGTASSPRQDPNSPLSPSAGKGRGHGAGQNSPN
ncbi:hypothetical protein EK21DRAFT_108819 [Setomelanomma holmii]|uniref:Uncharacterized protein n=1 Tax=Setomelanomma holmii TaxID=210430 RepID=A0A9P4LSF0_9PLEO|nr:hypothetical protein EK21DRAFT_108819 [Setomelanomma holmii]